MLNYIWMGLIIVALVVAAGNDINDEARNSYQNGVPLTLSFLPTNTPAPGQTKWEGVLTISSVGFESFYRLKKPAPDVRQPVTINLDASGSGTFFFTMSDETPSFWKSMAKSASTKDQLSGSVRELATGDVPGVKRVVLVFEPIHFVKMKAVTQAAIDFANTAVEIALGLIGVMALWLGLIKIAEEAGLVRLLTRVLAPITKRVFPDIPADHPAIGNIIMNTAANMLGLSNAATPIGLKAMEELNKLNPKPGTATNAMVTFLAINTGGLILIPATAIAVRAAAGSVNPGLIIGTSIFGAACATVAGVVASKLLQRLPGYRKQIEDAAPEKEVRNG
jgi:spore maturation protein A